MHLTIPLSVAILLAVGIMFIGGMYIAAPERMTSSFGLKLPSPDPDTRAWLRLKGIRDIVSGLITIRVRVCLDLSSCIPAGTLLA